MDLRERPRGHRRLNGVHVACASALLVAAVATLAYGGDLRHVDKATLALLTNRDVLAVNRRSTENRPHFVSDSVRVWSAKAEDGPHRYVAIFNTRDKPASPRIKLRDLGLRAPANIRDLWTGADLGRAATLVEASIPPHGYKLVRLD